MEFELTFYCLILLSTLLFLYYYTTKSTRVLLLHAKDKLLAAPPPPSPPALPILGHLHLFKDREHRSMASLAARYGPVVHLRLGCWNVVFISSPQAAEECFTQKDVMLADRPRFLRGELLAYNYTTSAWAPYGDLWRNLRRVTTVEALSTNRVNESGWIREEEILHVARERLIGPGRKEVDLNAVFFQVTKNVVMRVACGKRWDIDERKLKEGPIMAPDLMSLYDYFPVLRRVGFMGLEKNMKRVWKIWDEILENMIEEVRIKHEEEEVRMDEGERKMRAPLAHRLLRLQKAQPDFFTDDVVKGLILITLNGGTDNAARSMEWAMSLLLNHPKVLHKARQEIDSLVGFKRLVTDSDLQNLPYLRNILNETYRLFPVSPFLAPHCATADTTISGYHVGKGTVVILNVWAMHRDPNVWDDPLTFKPERFEEEQLHGKTSFKMIPFGIGRRACPGGTLSIKLAMLVLATCVQCFEWETVDGAPVDLEELGGGLTLRKRVPLRAVCRVRPCTAHLLATPLQSS